jgi:polyisoprenoid-binding protein YceI
MSNMERTIRPVRKLAGVAACAIAVVAFAAASRGADAAAHTDHPAAGAVTATVLHPAGGETGPALPIRSVTLRVSGAGNEARYRVREQLVGRDLPNDAVGATAAVTGGISIDENGRIVRAESRFTVDLTSLKSDSDRRDNYVRRNTLQTEQHPAAVFVPTGVEGLPTPLPATGEISFRVVGDLTVNGTTRPVTWAVTARPAGDVWTGSASTDFNFSYFGIPVPRVPVVLSVRESIRLEYDFTMAGR